jgi:thiamine-phosphate pyrophosphorylase
MLDYSLYLVTDRSLSRGRTTLDVVRQAVAGGVTCVQLREKHCSTREFINQARALQPLLKDQRIPLIINDRLDVALAVGADGIHLGQQDMALADARKIVGQTMVIGISAESVADAIRAEQQGADYIGVSPVFATPTKTDTAEALGLEGIQKIRRAVAIPIVGIGGVNQRSAAAVLGAGADGIAVVSAIVSADDPKQAAADLKKIITDRSVSLRP